MPDLTSRAVRPPRGASALGRPRNGFRIRPPSLRAGGRSGMTRAWALSRLRQAETPRARVIPEGASERSERRLSGTHSATGVPAARPPGRSATIAQSPRRGMRPGGALHPRAKRAAQQMLLILRCEPAHPSPIVPCPRRASLEGRTPAQAAGTRPVQAIVAGMKDGRTTTVDPSRTRSCRSMMSWLSRRMQPDDTA